MTSSYNNILQAERQSSWGAALSFLKGPAAKLVFAYLVLFAISAYLGRWTPDFLAGRSLWHFTISRMVIPFVMLGVFAAFIRVVPATLMLGASLLFIGTISAIKREATGEPFQVSDLFLAGQSTHLLGYVGWDRWLIGATILPASFYALRALRFRRWSMPLGIACVALLSTYRMDAIANFIHDKMATWGIENLTFSQAESERMNGLATHLYFSTAGLRLKNYDGNQVAEVLNSLTLAPLAAPRNGAKPDIYLILGEAWWRDPTDPNSPLDKLVASDFTEGNAVSPVYGGTTPNAEFEVLTGVPMRSFRAGIIPYQHYVQYLKPETRALPRMLEELGYRSRAFHNFVSHFWLRNQVYPHLGFESFESMENMQVEMQPNGWPKDDALYAQALKRVDNGGPEFNFLVTVATHGPFTEDKVKDQMNGSLHPGVTDYHDRLSGAADALIAFDTELRHRGRPYMLLIFGDHLPGLRQHQSMIGMTDNNDPRLHQVPFLISGNTGEAQALRDRLMGRPFYCFSPLIADQLGLDIADRYFRHMVKACSASPSPDIVTAEPVIQNQLFSEAPLL